MPTLWPRGQAFLEGGQIWVGPRRGTGYDYYDPWTEAPEIFRELAVVDSGRSAQAFARNWGPLGERQPETGPAGQVATENGMLPPPRGRLTMWDPMWHQPVGAYLRQAHALQAVTGALLALRAAEAVDVRGLAAAVNGTGIVPGRVGPRTRPTEILNRYFRWAGTESRSFILADDRGGLSFGYEFRSLVAVAVLGMFQERLERLRRCHNPGCRLLTAKRHCKKSHERDCPLASEHGAVSPAEE